jgi:four helix bundle protein
LNEQQFKHRTKALALEIIAFVEALPRSQTTAVIGRQLLRSATSVGANYRASCRGRSIEEVIAKLSIVEEEADETVYWLELLVESGACDRGRVEPMMRETDEILAMTVASKRTLKARIGTTGFGAPRPGRIGNRES